jgi:hypothetical protein
MRTKFSSTLARAASPTARALSARITRASACVGSANWPSAGAR